MREKKYVEAINEALFQLIENDNRVFLIGQGITSPWYVGLTTLGLIQKFGPQRIIDTPVSECCITGAAAGAALTGMHPIVMHPRMDFMFYAMDPIANHAANWHFMFGGNQNVPLTIWGIINRGGEQAAQHSQALHALFMHIPGLKVVMPSTPYDAKGLLISSVRDKNPVLFIDDRWLYDVVGPVPEEMYSVPIGKGIIRREGTDVTVVGASFIIQKVLEASDEIAKKTGADLEIIDLRSVKPIDDTLLFQSLSKTKRLIVVDGGWRTCGLGAEIIARVSESLLFNKLEAPPIRITLPDIPAPASSALEKVYYQSPATIIDAIKKVMVK